MFARVHPLQGATEKEALTNRAEWQVGSCVRSKMLWLGVPDERLALDSTGDRGRTGSSSAKTGLGGTMRGEDVVEFSVMLVMLMLTALRETEHLIALGKAEEARRSVGPRWCHGSQGCE
jgi:hypothetical protein